MASIFKRKSVDPRTGERREGKYWWISYMENGKQVVRSLKVTQKALAEIQKGEIERNLQRGLVGLPQLNMDTRKTLKEFEESVLDKLSPSWSERFRQQLKPWIRYVNRRKYFNLCKINTAVVEVHLHDRAQEVSAKTWNDELRAIDRFFRWCLDREYIVRNPCAPIAKRHTEKAPVEILTPEELGLIFKYAHKESLPYYKLLLYTGMRDGEARFLRWQDVYLEPGKERILIKSTAAHRTKNRRERMVPLAPEALEVLLHLLEKRGESKNPWVFPGTEGDDKPRGHNRNTWLALLKRIEKEAGVKIDKGDHMTGMHMFRHTFATNALASGVDIRTVQDWLGHASILQTQRYLNLLPDHRFHQIQKLKIQIGKSAGTEAEADTPDTDDEN